MIAKDARQFTDTINVGFSCGKDSLVTLDLCRRHFPKVHPFFMWLVPGLTFQEHYCNYIEQRMGVQVIKLPHWQLGSMLQNNSFRPGCNLTTSAPLITIKDMEVEVASRTGSPWFAYGLTRYDSLERNAMLKRCRGLDVKNHRVYPIMNFTRRAVFAYLQQHRIPLPIDYHMFGRSFGRLWPQELIAIKNRFPSDYEKIQNHFPHVEAQITRARLA